MAELSGIVLFAQRFVKVALPWCAISYTTHKENVRSLYRWLTTYKDGTPYDGTTTDTDRDRYYDYNRRPRLAPGMGRRDRTPLPPQGTPSGAAGPE